MALSQAFRLLDRFGTLRTFARLDPPGPPVSIPAKCMLRRTDEVPLAGEASQYDVQIFVRHETLIEAGFPAPPVKGDRVVSAAGEVYVVKAIESLHDEVGEVGGYRLWSRGH